MGILESNVVFYIGPLAVTDTVVFSWIAMAFIVGLVLLLRWRWSEALELALEFLNDLISDVMGRPAMPYLPFLGTLAIYIATSNVIGAIPSLSTPTSDINTPFALALVVFFSVHYFGIREKGLRGYLKDLATPIFTLPLEIIGQLSRTLALTLRLFGNILSGEMIVAVLFSLVPLFVPVPMTAFGLFTGILQAYIFTALASVYIAAGVETVIQPKGKTSRAPQDHQKE